MTWPCVRCGHPLGPQSVQTPQGWAHPACVAPTAPRKGLSTNAVMALAFGAMAICGTCMCVATLSSKPQKPQPPPGGLNSAEMPKSGEIGYAWSADVPGVIPLYDTKEALEAENRRQMKAIEENLRVRIVGGSMLYLHVEVLDGHWKGRQGWTDKAFVHKWPSMRP